MTEKSGTPVVRFKGFTDTWEQRKLGECVTFLDTMRKPLKESEREKGIYPYYGASGIVDYVSDYIFDEELVLLSEDGANITDRNYPVCFLAAGKYWVNNHAHVLKVNEENENNFICNSLERMDFTQYNSGMAMPKLNKDVCHNIPLFCPIYEEQKQIGDYFRNLDNLITLHQRKLDTLHKLKKSMLQKMFPKNGSLYPEIRFAGFTDAWEQRELSRITFPAGQRNKDDLDLEPYAITNDSGFIPQKDAHDEFGYMENTDRKAYIIVPPNSFAYNPARINVGSIGYYEGAESVIVSSLYEVFQTADCVDDKFLWYWLKSDDFPKWIEKLQEGSVRLYFYYDKLCECKMMMPSVEEQRKISSYLTHLDNLITLHQRK